MESIENKLLVSIVVITYNSSKYVLETLESAKNQTYKNVELIISDDNSTDNTVQLCEEWIKKNTNRFVNVKLLESDKNTGISGNLNRGIIASQGEWIKPIAGDDIMANRALSNYIDYISKTKSKIIGAKKASFSNNLSDMKIVKDSWPLFNNKRISASQQYEIALRGGSTPIITFIFKRDFVLNLGLFDEEIPMTEDKPFKLKVLKSGEKINHLPEVTMFHRKHIHSMSSNVSSLIYTNWQINSLFRVNKRDVFPYVSILEQFVLLYEIGIAKLFYGSVLNRRTKLSQTLNSILVIPIKLSYRYFRWFLEKRITNEIDNLNN